MLRGSHCRPAAESFMAVEYWNIVRKVHASGVSISLAMSIEQPEWDRRVTFGGVSL